jgi:ribosome-associated toxin RatA of RatAB toxin-antitoxin module
MWTLTSPAAGRIDVRRLFAVAALTVVAALPGATVRAAVDTPAPDVTVTEARGVYTVTATFPVLGPAATARVVLTDYEQLTRFVPDIRKSLVLERSAEGLVVEQEAVSKMMMFSKRVHLVLKVSETANVITFEDRCGESFKRYAGSWTINESAAGTTVKYQRVAEPTFDVPGFILKRLLRRDSRRMIELLQTEIAARSR